MPRRKTTLLTDGSPPAPNQTEETSCDSLKTSERPSKRRKTSVSSVTDHGGEEPADMDRKPRQTRSSGISQPTSKKASILSRAATETSSSASAAAATTTSTTTTTATPSSAGQAEEDKQTLPRFDQSGGTIQNESQQFIDPSVAVSQGHIVVFDSQKNLSMATLLPSALSEPVHHQHLHQEQFQRSQSSSAPPALASDQDSDLSGGQIRDRRSTRSLEALFKVTDSELQNMREDVPTIPSQDTVTIATGDQNYILLNDVQFMDQGEGTQIIITTSDMSSVGTVARVDGGDCYTFSVPSASTSEQIPISYQSGSSGRGEMFKLVLQNDNQTAVQQITAVGNQIPASTVVVEQPDIQQGVTQKEKTTSTPGRKRIHPQKPGKYKCKYCDRTCAKPSVLEKHLRAHTNERPFPCVVCGVSFKTKSNLSKHCKSNAHVNRTGLSWSGSADGPSSDSKEEDLKPEEEENDSEGTDTDVEGVGFVENDDDNNDGNPKVIVESAESVVLDSGGQICHGQTVRQESVLEGIRQKIENKNKRQQEKEGKSEMNKWFLRVFGAFDKPSESELAKYDDAETLVRENILTMDNVSKATEILNGLEVLKNEYSQQYPSTLPVLMTHQFLSDDRMMVKILKPKVKYLTDWTKMGSSPAVSVSAFGDQSQVKGSHEVDYGNSSLGGRISCLTAPSLVRSMSSSAVPTETRADAVVVENQQSREEERPWSQLMPKTNDKPVQHLSFDSSSQRPRLLSQRNDSSVGSLRSVFSQSSKESVLSTSSGDESSVIGQKQFLAVGDLKNPASPSRNPSLGDSNTAAFSTIQDGKPMLVYQHALDSDSDKMLKNQGRSLSSSVTPDMLKDRIQKIISTNAEIIDKHTLTEPPRPKNKYLRQTSDSSFQTLKMSDLRPSTDFDRLAVESSSEKQWKKKLAASLSVGDTEGALLRPDMMQRSMSTSSLRQFKSDSSDGSLINIAPQTLIVTAGQVGSSSNSLQVPGITHSITAPYQGEVMVLEEPHNQQILLQQQQHIKYSVVATTSSAHQHLEFGGGKAVALPIPASMIQKALSTDEHMSSALMSGLTQAQLDALNSVQVPSLTTSQIQALNKAQLVAVPSSSLVRQLMPGDSLQPSESADSSEGKPQFPFTTCFVRFNSIPDVKPQLLHLSETSKSFSVTSNSFNSVSPSGGRVTIQDNQNTGLGNQPAKLLTPSPSIAQSVPSSLPTKIVQGPGINEIQIQIKLSKNANDQSVGHNHPSGQAGALQVPSMTQKRSLDTPSIISSMLQAPRQLSPMVGQPGVQFPARSRTDSPLLATRSFSDGTADSKVSMASLIQTGSLDSTSQDLSATGKLKIGTSGSLHDQKKSMSRQGNVTTSSAQSKQSSFMTELQHRLSVPQNESPTSMEWKKDALASMVNKADTNKLTILTTEHFKNQGMSEGLAAAARAYLLTGPFTCEDCNESFQEETLRAHHRLLNCPKSKGLRRSLSATEVAAFQGEENKTTAFSDHVPTSGDLLIISNPEQLKKSSSALFKSLSTTDLQSGQQSISKDLPKLREQLVLVSSSLSLPSSLITTASATTASAQVSVSSSDSKHQKSQQSLIIENINPTQPRKKGRPKGSKNRPKDLNLVLAKARGAQIPSQAMVAATRQGSTGSISLEGSTLKDSLMTTPTMSSQSQVVFLPGQYRKLLLPRSGTVTTQTASAVADMPSTAALSSSATSTVNQLLTTTATSLNVAMTSNSMIGQPMVPVMSGGKIVRQLSSGLPVGTATKTGFVTATTKANICPGVPLIELSPGVSLPGLAITGTNSVSVLSPGTPISSLTPGTPKPGAFMIGYPVSGISSSTPGTPVTPLTPTNPLAGKMLKTQSHDSSSLALGATKLVSGTARLASGPGLTLNITSAQSVGSTQFSQMSPRVIPFIPAVTFHNMDPNSKVGGSQSAASPLLDQKSLQSQIRVSQTTPFSLMSAGTSTPGTPLTPATPDTPTDLSGTRRKLKDKLLMKQSLSVEKSQDKSLEKLLIMDSPSATQTGFFLRTNSSETAPVPVTASNPPVVLYQQGPKPKMIASNSALLASLTKPVVSSQKLGSLPNAVITSAVMGRVKDADKVASDLYTRSESETYLSPDTAKIHPPVLRAFSEPAVAKKMKKVKQLKPSPLSIEGQNIQGNSRLISRMLSAPKASQLTMPAGPEDLTSKKSLSFQSKIESTADSFDSGLCLRSLSQETPFFFPKSASIASLDSNELLIDLSGDNFNNVTIPINYAVPFVNVCRLQSGPLFSEWNHASRITGSQVNLSPLTLAGSKIQLPAVGGSMMMQKEQKNWLLKRSISLHRHFQILSRLWHSSSPVTLDSMTAMALAQGNPSPALLGHALLKYSSLTSSASSETPGSADPNKMKTAPVFSHSLDSIDLTKDESSLLIQKQQSGETSTDQGSESKNSPQVSSFHFDKALHTTAAIQLKAKVISIKGNSDASISTPSSGEDQQHGHPFSSSQALQHLTPVKSATFGINITTSSLLSPTSVSSAVISSVEQHITSVTPSGTLNTPMYGHSCPTLYTTTHVTFCCIQRPQPMYVAVKGSKKISMYSNWRLATHNPNPVGLNSRMLLALYKSRNVCNPVYSQCSMTPSNGGNQTHSSYWTYHRKKMAGVKKEVTEVKNEDTKSNSAVKTEPGKENKRHKLRLTRGGFKSNEKYEYIRGRGWGKYICEVCGIRCKKPSMLKKHLRTHTDLRPYHCRHCRFSFKTKGNLTKHMKSKSHQKKCLELGIIPIPTAVDDSQIDPAALEEQCRISREARIHDSMDAQLASGEEDDDEDMDGEEEEGDEDEEEEDDSMSREDTDDQSFDQERSGSSSSRVLKRQSSIDEPSPVFSFGQDQKSRPFLGQMGSMSRNREFSESSNVSYSSQSSLENRAISPHNIDTEIARSLLDLSQPRRSESREIVDEDARRHALTHLQSLITQLMAQKKPLSGLNLGGDSTTSGTSISSGKLMALSLGPSGDGMMRKTPSLSSFSSFGSAVAGPSQAEVYGGQSHPLCHDRIAQRGDNLSGDETKQKALSESPSSVNTTIQQLGMTSSDSLHGSDFSDYCRRSMEELYVITDDKHMRKGDLSKTYDVNERKESALSPSSKDGVLSTSSQSMPTRPTQLSFLKAPASPTKQQNSNLPSPSLFAFLPPYVSSRHAQRGRTTRTSDQGPIIGQFVRKDSQSISSSNVALTPNFSLAGGHSQPFQFNIPFPGQGISSDGADTDGPPTPSPVVTGNKGFIHTIPIVTITDTSLESPSPTVDSPSARFSDYEDGIKRTQSPHLSSATTSSTLTTSSSPPSPSEANKTTSTMPSSPGTTPQVSISFVKSSVRRTLESQGRSNSESATSLTSRRGSAIESLVRESAMPVLLVTRTEYSKTSMPDITQISSPSPNSQSDSCIDSGGYHAGKRSRRLSSGKSRFLQRQRSLADDTAFPSVEEDSVFDVTKPQSAEESSSSQPGEKSTDTTEATGKSSGFVKSSSFQDTTHEFRSCNDITPPNITASQCVDSKTATSEALKESPAFDKEKGLSNVKPSSCAFCSENFASVTAYTAHLQSRKHIGVLESLGMLPAGTFEKLQQSEQQENLRREEEEKEKLKEELEKETTLNDGKSTGGADEKKTILGTNSSIKEEMTTPKMEIEQEDGASTAAGESPLVRRSYSYQDNTSTSAVSKSGTSQIKQQRLSQKRKILHQPVAETATLHTPHLSENLRQSLAKRARFGIAHSSAQSGDSENDFDCPLVIDEQVKCSAPPSTLVSLLSSRRTSSTATATVSLSDDTKIITATVTSTLSSTQLPRTVSLLKSSSLLTKKLNTVNKVNDQTQADTALTKVAMEVDEDRFQNVPRTATKTASSMSGHSLSSATVESAASISSSLQTTSSSTAVSLPVSASVSYSLSMPVASQLQMPIMTHAELRPYVCEFCDAGFTNDRSLRTHLLTHGQDRPYICGNCGDTFAQWQDREVHYSSHSSTSIRQHQNNQQEMRMQTSQSAPSVSLASHQSLLRKEDKSVTSHKVGTKFSTNQNMGTTFSSNQNAGTTFATNQNVGPTFPSNQNVGTTFAASQNVGPTFPSNQNVGTTFAASQNVGTTFPSNHNSGTTFANQNAGDKFLISQNVVTSTNETSLSAAQKFHLLTSAVGEVKPGYSSSSSVPFPLNSNKLQVFSSDNSPRGDHIQNFEKHQGQISSFDLETQTKNKFSTDSNANMQSLSVTSYPGGTFLTQVTAQKSIIMRQETGWSPASSNKQELGIAAAIDNNSVQNAAPLEMNAQENSKALEEKMQEIEDVKNEQGAYVFADKSGSDLNQGSGQKINMAAEGMTLRTDLGGQSVPSKVGGDQTGIMVADEHGPGDRLAMEIDQQDQQQQQQLKSDEVSSLEQGSFQFEMSLHGYPQRHFTSPVYTELQSCKPSFPGQSLSSQGYQIQEGRPSYYGNTRAFDNIASGSTQAMPFSMGTSVGLNPKNWNRSLRANTEMHQFSLEHENVESSSSVCVSNMGHGTTSQESMVHQRSQFSRSVTSTESSMPVAYKTMYSEASSHEENMEYQSGYNGDGSHGFNTCQTEQQDCEEQSADPMLLPQTYYGLS